MAKENTVTGLDIGSQQIKAIIGRKNEDGIIDIIGLGTAKSAGLRQGMVVDIEDTISAVSEALSKAEKMAGITSEIAYVGMGGAHIKSSNSKGVIAVSSAEGEISEGDVDKVIEAARAVSVPPNREIIHVIPGVYTVDGQPGIHDPVGMTGVRLEVETHVISGSTPVMKNLSKSIYQAGLDIAELVFNPLATSAIVLSKQQKDVGVALIDFGAGTTDLVVFEAGNIMHSAVIPIGSSHITNDIAIGLRTSIETAEKIKNKFGMANSDKISEDEEIDISKIDPSESQNVSKKYLADIISARLSEIFTHISNQLKEIDREENLPAGVVFCGGGANLEGLIQVAKDGLRLPAQIGKPVTKISGLLDKVDNPQYATAIALMVWGINANKEVGGTGKLPIFSVTTKVKKWFKNLFT